MVTRNVLNKIQLKYSEITDNEIVYYIKEKYSELLLKEYSKYLIEICNKYNFSVNNTIKTLIEDYNLYIGEMKQLYLLNFTINNDSDYIELQMSTSYCNDISCNEFYYMDRKYYDATISITGNYNSWTNVFDYVISNISFNTDDENDLYLTEISNIYKNSNAQEIIIRSITDLKWYKLFGEYCATTMKVYSAINEINKNLHNFKKDSYETFCNKYLDTKTIELLVNSDDISSGYIIYNLL